MKPKQHITKTITLIISFAIVLSLTACGRTRTSTPVNTEAVPTPHPTVTVKPDQAFDSEASQTPEHEADALAAYDEFLTGDIDAQDSKHEISDGVVTMKELSLEPDYKTYHAFFDMNGDGIPELHLRPTEGGSYMIFTYLDGQIVLWHNGPDYEGPINNGAILYERDGAAPTHINYYYLTLDSNGNELSKVYFAKYHSVDQSGTKESADYDTFVFEDKEVTEEEWNSLTREYLSNSSDLIQWID